MSADLQTVFLSVQAADAAQPAPARLQLVDRPGAVATRDGRHLTIDYATVLRHFRADGLKLPVDINHATEIKAPQGEEAEAIGWIVDLAVEGERLMAAVRWRDRERARKAVRHDPYVSPAFLKDAQGVVSRLKSAALVASPALAGQPALAGAGHAAGAQGGGCGPDPALLALQALDGPQLVTHAIATGRLPMEKREEFLAVCGMPGQVAHVRAMLAAAPAGVHARPAAGLSPDPAGERAVAEAMGLTYAQFCAAKAV